MKQIFPAFAGIVIISLLSCTPFSTRYDRIEPDKIRPLSVIYSPLPEGAPGDTVRLRLHCAGQPVVNVSWQMSYDVVMDAYGSDTALNWRPLDTVATVSALPDSMDVEFVVPQQAFDSSVALEKNLRVYRGMLPPKMQGMSQQQLAAMVHEFASATDTASLLTFALRWGGFFGTTSPDTILGVTSLLVTKVFSIKAYLFADLVTADGNRLRVKSDFVIRYNSRLASTLAAGLVNINHNPKVGWMGVFSVHKEGLFMFDPHDPQYAGLYSFQYIYNTAHPDSVRDTVDIDVGYSYFVVADSGYERIAVNATGSLFTPRVMADTGILFVKTSKVRFKVPLHRGDSVRLPLVVSRPVMINYYMRPGGPLLPPTRDAPAGDTIFMQHGPDSVAIKFVVDTILDTFTKIHESIPRWISVARTDISLYTGTRDIGVTLLGTADLENYAYDWFYENIDADSASLPLDSLMTLVPSGDAIQAILPSQDEKMHRARIWTVVYDGFLGEPGRPIGFAQAGAEVYFKYTEAYRNKFTN